MYFILMRYFKSLNYKSDLSHLRLEFGMVQMEQGSNNKENVTDEEKFVGNVANHSKNAEDIISHEELQPEVTIPEFHLVQDQNSKTNDESQDSKNIFNGEHNLEFYW